MRIEARIGIHGRGLKFATTPEANSKACVDFSTLRVMLLSNHNTVHNFFPSRLEEIRKKSVIPWRETARNFDFYLRIWRGRDCPALHTTEYIGFFLLR